MRPGFARPGLLGSLLAVVAIAGLLALAVQSAREEAQRQAQLAAQMRQLAEGRVQPTWEAVAVPRFGLVTAQGDRVPLEERPPPRTRIRAMPTIPG